jgi:hypothetical protein
MLQGEHTEKSERKAYGELWDAPFAVIVPPANLAHGATNVLAVRASNAIGNGGIWRPVLGHAGNGR